MDYKIRNWSSPWVNENQFKFGANELKFLMTEIPGHFVILDLCMVA